MIDKIDENTNLSIINHAERRVSNAKFYSVKLHCETVTPIFCVLTLIFFLVIIIVEWCSTMEWDIFKYLIEYMPIIEI
jgi:hypothetical protein